MSEFGRALIFFAVIGVIFVLPMTLLAVKHFSLPNPSFEIGQPIEDKFSKELVERWDGYKKYRIWTRVGYIDEQLWYITTENGKIVSAWKFQ